MKKKLHPAVVNQIGYLNYLIKQNKIYYQLINEFFKKTGCPLILNTSFNINGKPIMSNTKDALDYFKNSNIDVLVIGDKIFKK